MEINPDIKERQKERPDVSADERASSALLKRIRKLRWIGMEAEAEQLQIVLTEFTRWTGCSLVDGSLDCARSSQLHPSHWRQTDEPLDKN